MASTVVVPVRPDTSHVVKMLRILSQLLHDVHALVEDAATDLELLAAEHEDGDQGDEPAAPKVCPKCLGDRWVANTDRQEPWSAWCELPAESRGAVLAGVVMPMRCPECTPAMAQLADPEPYAVGPDEGGTP